MKNAETCLLAGPVSERLGFKRWFPVAFNNCGLKVFRESFETLEQTDGLSPNRL